jgi:multiple sugar transport system substrate-binding protein
MKTNSIKKVLSCVFGFLLAFTAVGCGGNSGDSSDSVELTIGVVNQPSEVKIINSFIKAYKEQPGNENKKIKVTKITDNYDTWVQRQQYVNKLPDMIQVYDYSSEFWTYMNMLQPISDYMERDGIKESDYYSSVIEMAKSKAGDNKMYWVPRDYNKVVVCYNTKMFELAGIEKPSDDWTFEQFEDVCEQLLAAKDAITDYSGSPYFWPADMRLQWAASYYPVISSYGGGLIDKENEKAFENIDAVKKGFDYYLSYVDRDLCVTTDDTTDAFANKQAAMIFTSRPDVPTYNQYLDGEIDFVSFPTLSDATEASYIGMGCTGYGITDSCSDKNKELAWDFLKFVISKEGQNAFSKTGSGIPMLKSLAEDPEAEFRKVYEGKNNDAFVKFAERDIPMNYMRGFKPNKQLGIYSYINANLLTSFVTAKDRAKCYEDTIKQLEKTFQ